MRGHPRRDLERETQQGYRLEQVVADLVDNCVDAGAENVEIIFNEEMYIEKKSHYLIVLDDGIGIEEDKISSIMDFGVEREYDELDLGKFGVGLKSSSLSQAKEITVMSKKKGGNINLRRLSYQEVWDRDQWVLLPMLRPEMETHAIDVATDVLNSQPSGTAVVLEDMHKLDLQVGHEDQKDEYLNSEYSIIREYLSLVFERYLTGLTLKRSDGSEETKELNIFFNGKHDMLEPLDPFCRDLKDGSQTGTLCLKEIVKLSSGETIKEVPVTIWITPKANDRPSSLDGRLRVASRDLSIREMQGIYFYRNGRLVDFPGWKKVLKVEEHMTCLRWEVEFPPHLDKMFQLDPSKREVKIAAQLRESFIELTKRKIRWHNDDEQTANHRARARTRQSGKDAIKPVTKQTTLKKTRLNQESQKTTTTIVNPLSKSSKTTSAQPLNKVKINKIAGSKTGHVVINEKQEGGTWNISLNTNHAMYESFVEAIIEGSDLPDRSD